MRKGPQRRGREEKGGGREVSVKGEERKKKASSPISEERGADVFFVLLCGEKAMG